MPLILTHPPGSPGIRGARLTPIGGLGSRGAPLTPTPQPGRRPSLPAPAPSHRHPWPRRPEAWAAGYLARPRSLRSPTAGTCWPGAISERAAASPHPPGRTFSGRTGRPCTLSRQCTAPRLACHPARAAPSQQTNGWAGTIPLARPCELATSLAAPGLSGPASCGTTQPNNKQTKNPKGKLNK